jgi:hypothetical protein
MRGAAGQDGLAASHVNQEDSMSRLTPYYLVLFLMALTACKAAPVQEPWSEPSDGFLERAGDRLETLERALAKEDRNRLRVSEMASVWAGRIGRFIAGDPFAVDEAQRKLAALQSELAEQLTAEEARLEPPKAALKAAREALEAAEAALAKATRLDAEMSGTLATGSQGDRCGSDGCGGDCGTCEWSEVCYELVCRCIPECAGRECGRDGCGGVCGTGRCSSGYACSDVGRCQQIETKTECRANCRSLPAGPVDIPVRTKDYSARTERRWNPQKLGSLDDAKAYLAVLKRRKSELDGFIAGSDVLDNQLAGIQSKLATTKTEQTELTGTLASEKKAHSAAAKAVKKIPEEERAAAQEKLTEQAEKILSLTARLAALKTESKDLVAQQKSLEKQIKGVAKELPEIAGGSLRLGPEIQRISNGVDAWQKLKEQVAARRIAVEDARAEVAAAEKQLSEMDEQVEKAKAIHRETYGPVIESAGQHLASLLQPAFGEVLIGAAVENGLNHESSYILALRDEGRLSRVVEAVTELKYNRIVAWEALTVEQQEEYPNWTKEVEWLDDYLRIVGELGQSTTRSRALETRLLEERTRLLEVIADGKSQPQPK